MQDTATHHADQDSLLRAREALEQERRNVESMRLDLVNRQADMACIEHSRRIDYDAERSWFEWQQKKIRQTKKYNMKRTKFLRAKLKEFEAREAALDAREAALAKREAAAKAAENPAKPRNPRRS